MSDEGTRVVAIPGGEQLLSNVTTTGKLLIVGGEIAGSLTREDLIKVLKNHARLGQAMVEAIERCREKMDED